MKTACWQVGIIAVFSLMVLFGRVTPAHAWSWEDNPYTFTGSGSAFCSDDNLPNPQDYPCVLWYQPNNTSINVGVSLEGNLANFPDYNFVTPTLNGMQSWNSQPAWNPYLVQCTQAPCGSVDIYGTLLPCHTYGSTGLGTGTPFFYNGNWHAYIEGADLQLNNAGAAVLFHNSTATSEGDCVTTPDQEDGRQTVTHELGHVLGIGHSFLKSALMYASNYCACYTPQADDIAAIKGIYPGYIP